MKFLPFKKIRNAQSNNTPIMPIAQQIFTGTTWHVRHLPSVHKFSYPYRYWGLNLTQLQAGEHTMTPRASNLQRQRLPEIPLLFSRHSKAVQRIDFGDYLTETNKDTNNISTDNNTATGLLARLNQQWMGLTGSQPTGEVLALVVGRNLGFYFSPVNFYIGFDSGGKPSHLLAEVSNTPWEKRHHYAFLLDGEQTTFCHDKGFHVSPFNPIDQTYRWEINISPYYNTSDKALISKAKKRLMRQNILPTLLNINIAIHVKDARGDVFAAGVKLNGKPLTKRNIYHELRKNPIMSFTSVAQIYAHAFKLFVLKRVPYINYDEKLADSKQRSTSAPSQKPTKNRRKNATSFITPQTSNPLNMQGHATLMPNQSQPSKSSKKSQNANIHMPTDRSRIGLTSPIAKASQRLTHSISQSTAFRPIDKGIDTLARQIVRQALKQLQFGQLIVVEAFTANNDANNEAQNTTKPSKSVFGSKQKNSKSASNKSLIKKVGGSVASKLGKPLNRRWGKSGATNQQTLTSSDVGNHPLAVTVTIYDISVYRQLLFGGSIALADSFINGQWQTDDLTGLIRLAARNLSVLNKLENRFASATKTLERAKHRLRGNDKATAKSNILAHYDLGNEMYQKFLDPSMMYSSAVYPNPDSSLAEAQAHKLKLICEQLELSEQDHVIEIGTGWGGFAIYAASNYGCHVTTTTISDAQYDEAQRRVKQAGLEDKITLLKQDYRDLTGQYDKLVSIEMIEAVGHEYLPTFFAKCNELLKPTGKMVLQAITFNDQGYADYLESVDFIQTHIFPGGCLLSNQEIINRFTEQTDMVVKSLIDYGYDYAHTLKDWREAFFAQQEDIQALGYDDAFMRLWDFYFSYCEGGFLERTIGVVQVMAVKPEHR